MSGDVMVSERFVDFLATSGRLDQAAADRLRHLAAASPQPLPVLVSRLGLLPDAVLAAALAEYHRLPVVQPTEFPATPILPEQITEAFLRQHRVVPLADLPDRLLVAVVDPADPYPAEALALIAGKPVATAVATDAEVEAALERLYGTGTAAATGKAAVDSTGPTGGRDDFDAERLRDLASEAPVLRLVAALLTGAVEAQASDLHIEPGPDRLLVRTRIDGLLRVTATYPPRLQAALVSRIKIMAGLNIAERRRPQDGRCQTAVRGRTIDIRVSVVPTLFGESVVLRLLDRDRAPLSFDRLGFETDLLERFLGLLDRPHGIVLVTGPTGAGKTTTLYAALNRLNAPERKILTAEDPIEYHLTGINQIQVAPKIGLDFAAILRAVLRQDPDVLMVGEIRDPETARMAVQAALTGHLVLSTVHTNSAAATVTRLTDMGLEPYLLAASLIGILAQRLVRTLCPDCAEPEVRRPAELGLPTLARLAVAGSRHALKRARGCARCGGTGYRGRTVIAELLPVTPAMAALIASGAQIAALGAAARADGMRSLTEDGCRKALLGTTTPAEVLRVCAVEGTP